MKKQWCSLLIWLTLLLFIICLPAYIYYQTGLQAKRNVNLIAAVKCVDANEVTVLLDEGADANAHETPNQTSSPSQILKQWMARLRHQSDENENESSDSNLNLILMAAIPENAANTYSIRKKPHRDLSAYDSIASALIVHGAELNAPDLKDALHIAAYYDMHLTVRALLRRGVNVNFQGDHKDTPLMYADEQTTALLLQYNANSNLQDNDGRTALMYACKEDNKNTGKIKLLLATGCDPNGRDNYGETPLMFARSSEVAAILLQHGADFKATDKRGESVLAHAYTYRDADKENNLDYIDQDEALIRFLKAYRSK